MTFLLAIAADDGSPVDLRAREFILAGAFLEGERDVGQLMAVMRMGGRKGKRELTRAMCPSSEQMLQVIFRGLGQSREM